MRRDKGQGSDPVCPLMASLLFSSSAASSSLVGVSVDRRPLRFLLPREERAVRKKARRIGLGVLTVMGG